jgi:protein involved in polysaccharide export with SLBB domain
MAAGCSTTQSIRVREHEPEGFAAWSDAPLPYRLGPGDRVRVDFLLTPELAQDAVVEPDGRIGLKVAGRVTVQNLTVDQAEAVIAQAAAAHLLHPIVTLAISDPRAARIIVGGAVQRPGVYPLPPRASPLEAVTLAGGLLPESRMDEVVILRQRPGAAAMLKTVDLRRFVSTGSSRQSLSLASEDIVYVPRSRIGEFDLWIEENINRTLPFSRSVDFTNVGSVKP